MDPESGRVVASYDNPGDAEQAAQHLVDGGLPADGILIVEGDGRYDVLVADEHADAARESIEKLLTDTSVAGEPALLRQPATSETLDTGPPRDGA